MVNAYHRQYNWAKNGHLTSEKRMDKSDQELAELLTLTVTVDADGDTVYVNQLDQRHRVHGPAVITSDGEWWYKNGRLHRDNGPAIEWAGGGKSWYLNGEHLTEEEYNERVKSM